MCSGVKITKNTQSSHFIRTDDNLKDFPLKILKQEVQTSNLRKFEIQRT